MLCALLLTLLPAVAPADTTRVLFLGNSYTYVNDLPALVRDLSASGEQMVVTEDYTPGGYTLTQHSQDSTALAKIAAGPWDFVVLQEQSQVPTIEHWRYGAMYPAARRLDSLIRGQGARTMFYMTWGRKYGGTQTWGGYSSPPFADFFEMQDSLCSAYTMIATELGARLAPVGIGWACARRADSLVDLWQSDYSHPTLEGSYLGACVFYAVLFNADPRGLAFHGGLDSATARFCQEMAWQAVSGLAETRSSPARAAALTALPNPSSGIVRFAIPGTLVGERLEILDVAGRPVRALAVPVNGMTVWDGRSEDGKAAPTGTYLARLTATGQTARFIRLH
jgi:hypothetical protein